MAKDARAAASRGGQPVSLPKMLFEQGYARNAGADKAASEQGYDPWSISTDAGNRWAKLHGLVEWNPAETYSYDGRDYPSVAAARAANPQMQIISNPPSAASEYQARRGRAFFGSIGSGALGLGPLSYVMGGAPETIQASSQFDNALGDLASANALRPGKINSPEGLPRPPGAFVKERPENFGFVYSTRQTLRPGERIDRVGDEEGDFVAPYGTSFEGRSLPRASASEPYHVYEVLRPLDVRAGPAMPWHGQPGMEEQYRLPGLIKNLVKDGMIRHRMTIDKPKK